MSLLITGASGKLGSQLVKLLPEALTPSHNELNFTHQKEVKRYIQENGVESIIHCGALTSVRHCEAHKREAYRVNVLGTKNLLDSLSLSRAYFLYVSTACVFPGDELEKYYTESDLPHPKNYYALTKLLGELYVANTPSISTLIVRTNFIEQGGWPYSHAFGDRFANYLYSDQCAERIFNLYEKRVKGLIHVAGDVRRSMYEWAKIEDPNVRNTSLYFYHGPPLTVNMCLETERSL